MNYIKLVISPREKIYLNLDNYVSVNLNHVNHSLESFSKREMTLACKDVHGLLTQYKLSEEVYEDLLKMMDKISINVHKVNLKKPPIEDNDDNS